MSGEILDQCGIYVAHTLHDVHSGMKHLQHRGRDAAGIAAIADDRIDVLKWVGRVSEFEVEDLCKTVFPTSRGYHTFFGHVRYVTKGRKDKILEDAHPHVIGGHVQNRGSHIIITNCEAAIVHNGQVDLSDLAGIDRRLLHTGCDSEALLHFFRRNSGYGVLDKIPGSYTAAFADIQRKNVVVLRDRHGIKPGALGFKDGKYCISSEDIAIRKNGGEIIEDLKPGVIYYLNPNGSFEKINHIVIAEPKHCFFEWNYIAHHESVINGIPVRRLRQELGIAVAEDIHPDDVDVVTYLPRCPEIAAKAYADHLGLKFEQVFYKMKSERAFLGPDEEERASSIKANLHLSPFALEGGLRGLVVLCMDDSMVRGNNCTWERELLYRYAGVKKAYHVNYTPMIGIIGSDGKERGCDMGVDMPLNDNFIARGRTAKQISGEMRMPVLFPSLECMAKAYERCGIPRERLCTYCIGGKHPFK